MNQFITLVLTIIVAINNIRISQATLYTYANNVKEDHIPAQSALAGTASNHFKLNTAAIENKENIQQPHENKLKFHHTIQQKSGLNQDTLIKYPTHNENIRNLHNPSKLYTSVDYNVEHDNDVVDAAYKKQTLYQQQPIKYDDYDLTQQEKPSLLKQLQSQHQELSEGYATFLQDAYQVVAPPKQESGGSNDHQQSHYLTAYVTPPPRTSPYLPNSKMHLNLQHHQQNYNNNKPKIVSYATGNEASPTSTSTTSIKSQQQQLRNMLQYGVKYVTNNELNSYDFNRQPALVYGQPGGVLQSGSKQYVYAPMHSALDRKLPYSIKTFPYPPSFISLTTTEKPFNNYYNYNHRSAYKKIPDLFSHRQSKSLLDSYIPSWQVTNLLQQYQGKQSVQSKNNNNLHTLAFVMPYKNYYKRDVNKVKK